MSLLLDYVAGGHEYISVNTQFNSHRGKGCLLIGELFESKFMHGQEKSYFARDSECLAWREAANIFHIVMLNTESCCLCCLEWRMLFSKMLFSKNGKNLDLAYFCLLNLKSIKVGSIKLSIYFYDWSLFCKLSSYAEVPIYLLLAHILFHIYPASALSTN